MLIILVDILATYRALIAEHFAGFRIAAVSYTHLDVYKRQLYPLWFCGKE